METEPIIKEPFLLELTKGFAMNLPKFRKNCCSTSSLLRCQMMEVFEFINLLAMQKLTWKWEMQLTWSVRCRKVGPSECGKRCLGFLQLNPGTVSRCVNHCQEETSDSLHQEK